MHGAFDLLDPDSIFRTAEQATGRRFDGTLTPYPSYINRVYGLRDEDGGSFIIKFYRPGRWSAESIHEEHRFIMDCHEMEIPVVPPETLSSGSTLGEFVADDGGTVYRYAVFLKKAGRNFDAELDDDWLRLGSLTARVHLAGKLRPAPERIICSPQQSSSRTVEELLRNNLVHPEMKDTFSRLCRDTLERISPLFEGVDFQRIHGDCHRGNILDRVDGLILMDFDDMMTGPRIQDLWLLLPGRAADCRRELLLLLEGYEQFLPFNRQELPLIEPLRFMRMLYYLGWCARQRSDNGFPERYPDWGTRAFWIREIEDLREQASVISDQMESGSDIL